MSYPQARKETVLKKILPSQSHSIPKLARAEGISEGTLYVWRKAARAAGRLMPNDGHTPAGWTSVDTFAAVVETAALHEMELPRTVGIGGCIPRNFKAGDRPVSRRMTGTGVRPDGFTRPAKRISTRSSHWPGS